MRIKNYCIGSTGLYSMISALIISGLFCTDYRSTIFQRYEWVGDRVLNLKIAEILYNDEKYKNNNNLSRINKEYCQKISNDKLAKVFDKLGLIKIFQDIKIEKNKSDIIEAIIGELYIKRKANKLYKKIINNIIVYIYHA